MRLWEGKGFWVRGIAPYDVLDVVVDLLVSLGYRHYNDLYSRCPFCCEGRFSIYFDPHNALDRYTGELSDPEPFYCASPDDLPSDFVYSFMSWVSFPGTFYRNTYTKTFYYTFGLDVIIDVKSRIYPKFIHSVAKTEVSTYSTEGGDSAKFQTTISKYSSFASYSSLKALLSPYVTEGAFP